MGDIRSRKPWLTFTEARDLVQDECLRSKVQYYRWWDHNRPGQIPKYPYNVWKSEWKGWNDFLGNNNSFQGVKRSYIPFAEALRFVHSLKLTSQAKWFEYVRDNGLPEGVPSRADYVYKDVWVSWNHWLGNTAAARVAVQQAQQDDPGYLYIVHLVGRPANVFRIGVVSEVKGLAALGPHNVVKLFKMEKGYDWEATASRYGKRWWEDDKEWIIGNINEMLFDIDLAFV